MRTPILAALLLIPACARSAPVPAAAEPTAAAAALPWSCHSSRQPDGDEGSACWASMEQCESSLASLREQTPDWQHTPCTGAATASCFDGDLLDNGEVLLASADFCYAAASHCEDNRAQALEDPEVRNVGACGAR